MGPVTEDTNYWPDSTKERGSRKIYPSIKKFLLMKVFNRLLIWVLISLFNENNICL